VQKAMPNSSKIVVQDYGTNCKDCQRYPKLGDICLIEHGKKFQWEFCRDFDPVVVLPDYNELMRSVRADHALERKKAKEKKEKEKRRKLREREEKKELKRKKRRAMLRRRRELLKKKALLEAQRKLKSKSKGSTSRVSEETSRALPKFEIEKSDSLDRDLKKPKSTGKRSDSTAESSKRA
jgi:hypothetical protein